MWIIYIFNKSGQDFPTLSLVRTIHTALEKWVRFFPCPSQGHMTGSKNQSPFSSVLVFIYTSATPQWCLYIKEKVAIMRRSYPCSFLRTYTHAKHLLLAHIFHSHSKKEKNKQQVCDNCCLNLWNLLITLRHLSSLCLWWRDFPSISLCKLTWQDISFKVGCRCLIK